MTPYHEYFVPFFLLGFLIAGTASFVAGRMSGCVVPGVLLWIGVMVSWAALFIGSHLGYRAWQSMPDAPDEAFRDTSAAGALFLGWFPGLVFCLAVFGLVRGIRWACIGRIRTPMRKMDGRSPNLLKLAILSKAPALDSFQMKASGFRASQWTPSIPKLAEG